MSNNNINDYFANWIPNDSIIAIQCGQKRYEVESKTSQFLNNNNNNNNSNGNDGSNNDLFSCSVCNITDIKSIDLYKEHYKSEWHNHNIRRDILDMPIVSYDEYTKLTNEEKQSTTDEYIEMEFNNSNNNNDHDDEVRLLGSPRINIFTCDNWNNYSNISFTFWKAVLLHPSEVEYSIVNELKPLYRELSTISNTLNETPWAIFLSQGGRFAGAIFDPKQGCLQHKTFQRYTVRRKQGGSQIAKDSQNATSQPKSVGSSLRRHNWTRLGEDIAELLEAWKELLAKCSRIFVHAPSYNRRLLFGKEDLLDAKDIRVRLIPCIVHNITFKEAERVYNVLKRVDIQSSDAIPKIQDESSDKKDMNYNIDMDTDNNLDNVKLKREISEESSSSSSSVFRSIHEKIYDAIDEDQSLSIIENLCRNYLSDVPHFCGKSALVLCVKKDNKEIINLLLKFNIEDINVSNKDSGDTPLHMAVELGNIEMIKFLLNNGGDPTIRDLKKRTVYDRAPNKNIRNIFRIYAADHPDQYDYESINLIPATMEQLDEAANKLKAKKAAKRRRQKKKKKQREKQVEENENNIETVSESKNESHQSTERSSLDEMRKKRLEHLSKSLPSSAITGTPCDNPECNKALPKKPFEWTNYKYCSVMCVQFHRLMMQHNT